MYPHSFLKVRFKLIAKDLRPFHRLIHLTAILRSNFYSAKTPRTNRTLQSSMSRHQHHPGAPIVYHIMGPGNQKKGERLAIGESEAAAKTVWEKKTSCRSTGLGSAYAKSSSGASILDMIEEISKECDEDFKALMKKYEMTAQESDEQFRAVREKWKEWAKELTKKLEGIQLSSDQWQKDSLHHAPVIIPEVKWETEGDLLTDTFLILRGDITNTEVFSDL